MDTVTISAKFHSTKELLPDASLMQPASVYFVCNGKLYKGLYYVNGNFYAYTTCGNFECFASKNGRYEGLFSSGQNEVCTHWCYEGDLTINVN